MAKSPDAFRTISEVADWLGVQAHVLRFWESKFTQVKPIKRAGGRRYYRPADMLLLGGLKQLLHEDGLTIKGAQKLLREKGVAHVADLSQPLDDLTIAVIEGSSEEAVEAAEADVPTPAVDLAQEEIDGELVASVQPEPVGDPAPVDVPEDVISAEPEPEATPEPEEPEVALEQEPEPEEPAPLEVDTPDSETPAEDDALVIDAAPEFDQSNVEIAAEPAEEPAEDAMPAFRARSRDAAPAPESAEKAPDTPAQDPEVAASEPAPEEAPLDRDDAREDTGPFSVTPPTAQPDAAPVKPRVIDVGPLPELIDFAAEPSALSYLAATKSVSADQAEAIRPLLARLTRLRASMASPRKDIRED